MAAHVRSSFPSQDVPSTVSAPSFILQDAATYGNRPALIDASTGQRLSYTSLIAGVRRVASGLYRRFQRYPTSPDGQNENQSTSAVRRPLVCLYSGARLEFPIVVHGVLLAGGTVTTADISLSTEELTRQFEILLPDFIVTDYEKVDDAQSAASKVGSVKEIIVMGKFLRGFVSVEELLRDDGRAPLDDVIIDYKNDVTIVPFDVDARGRLRGVMHTHHSFAASVAALGCPNIAPMSRNDVVCCCHQMSSMVGLVFYCGLLLREGATGIILPQFSNRAMLEAITKFKVDVVHVTPTAAEYMAYDPKITRSALVGMRRMYCSGATLREGVIGTIMARSGLTEVREGFGTSGAPAVLSVRRGETLPGYAGLVCPNTEVQIRDVLFGGVVESETYGEICVRGPQVMRGNLYKSGPSAHKIKDGWLQTGYIGQMDQGSNFSLLGQIDGLIGYDSYQISPIELERVVRQHPDVEDAVVVGIENHGAGHVPRAYVIKKQGADVIALDIIEYVAEEVVDHKKLRGGVVFADEIPKTLNGEPERYKLQAEANKQELDISLGEHAKWPPDGDYIDDMQLIANRGSQHKTPEQNSIWGEIEVDSFNFSNMSNFSNFSGGGQGSGVFSHSSLKFDGDLDGFITTRDPAKTKTPEAPSPKSPIRNKPSLVLPTERPVRPPSSLSTIPTSTSPVYYVEHSSGTISYEKASSSFDENPFKPIQNGQPQSSPAKETHIVKSIINTNRRRPVSPLLNILPNVDLHSNTREHAQTDTNNNPNTRNSVRFADDEDIYQVESEGGDGVYCNNVGDIPELTDLAVDPQPPMRTSTPKQSPRLRPRTHFHDAEQKPKVQLFDSSFESNASIQSLDQSSIYPNTDTSFNSSTNAAASVQLQKRGRTRGLDMSREKSPQRPVLTRKKGTTLGEAMNLASQRNMRNMGGSYWNSTGDLSASPRSMTESDDSLTQSATQKTTTERPSRSRGDSRCTAANNIRMRATQYSEQVRQREIGVASRSHSSYRDSFNKSGSNGSGAILYTPRSRSKSSDRSSYLSGSRAYSSFSLTNRFDVV